MRNAGYLAAEHGRQPVVQHAGHLRLTPTVLFWTFGGAPPFILSLRTRPKRG